MGSCFLFEVIQNAAVRLALILFFSMNLDSFLSNVHPEKVIGKDPQGIVFNHGQHLLFYTPIAYLIFI